MVMDINGKQQNKNLIIKYNELLLKIYLNLILIVVAVHIIKNIVDAIPSPFDGLYVFKHNTVKELGGSVIFGFTIFYYQTTLRKKINYLFDKRLLKKN